MGYETYKGSFAGTDTNFGGYRPMGNFGKGMMVAPPPSPGKSDWQRERELMEMKHKHEMEMMKLRLEMQQLQRKGTVVPSEIKTVVAKGGDASASEIKNLKEELEKLKRKEYVAKQGGEVKGSKGASMKELLVGKKHAAGGAGYFTRESKQSGLDTGTFRFKDMQSRIPADFDEAKYLAKHPDVAKAVKSGKFPSGAFHYAVYGSPDCLRKQEGRKCDNRALAGWRQRPGNLAGIFANWDWRF
jgi:hypothetical protein